jgi:hypothetical protein
MPKAVKLLCLANSRKLGNSCVAGINLGNGEWLRPVNEGGGALLQSDIRFEDKSSPQLLDIIEIPVLRPEPLYYQPENWIIDKEYYWIKIGNKDISVLNRYIDQDEYVLRNQFDRIRSRELKENPIARSLALIKIRSITFRKTRSAGKRAQVRAMFQYNKNDYDLVVTDRQWEARFFQPNGPFWEMRDYPFEGTFYLVISLGETYGGYHYKLVVAVIQRS